jgi:hypothetical protein
VLELGTTGGLRQCADPRISLWRPLQVGVRRRHVLGRQVAAHGADWLATLVRTKHSARPGDAHVDLGADEAGGTL